MKKFLVSSLLVVLGSVLFTSCSTTVPRDNTSTTNTSTSRTYSK